MSKRTRDKDKGLLLWNVGTTTTVRTTTTTTYRAPGGRLPVRSDTGRQFAWLLLDGLLLAAVGIGFLPGRRRILAPDTPPLNTVAACYRTLKERCRSRADTEKRKAWLNNLT